MIGMSRIHDNIVVYRRQVRNAIVVCQSIAGCWEDTYSMLKGGYMAPQGKNAVGVGEEEALAEFGNTTLPIREGDGLGAMITHSSCNSLNGIFLVNSMARSFSLEFKCTI